MALRNSSNGETRGGPEEIDSSCSTPYVSAPSSPGRNTASGGGGGYFFSAPASPMHFVLSSDFITGEIPFSSSETLAAAGSFEFDGANPSGSMISADEIFLNGQIRPMRLSSHLQRPQKLSPLLDLNEEDEEEAKEREMRLRSRSVHRRARSMSPVRNSPLHWEKDLEADPVLDLDLDPKEEKDLEARPSDSSASSSRSSSSGRNSKRWIFLKDLLYRSKSEGRERTNNGKEKEKDKFWHSISFSRSKPPPIPISDPKEEKEKAKTQTAAKRPTNGVGKRRGPLPSAHERHYTANRAQAEEMRKRTFLPYREGLFGCLGLSSRSYGAFNGFAKSLNPVSSSTTNSLC